MLLLTTEKQRDLYLAYYSVKLMLNFILMVRKQLDSAGHRKFFFKSAVRKSATEFQFF